MQEENQPHPAARLAQYLNARVTVYYSSQVTDTGTLTYLDWVWVELTKDNGERLLIPHQAIRIIKLLEPSATQGDAATLLRASMPNTRASLPGATEPDDSNETRQLPRE